jgi:O-antigen/teichoic acid export membrane protein
MNHVNAVAGGIGKLAGAAGAAWAAWHHQGLLAMSLWIGGGNLLQSAIYLAWWQRLRIHGMLRRAFMTNTAVREFARFCAAMFAVQFSAILITGMDMPIVAAFDFRSAAFYAVAATASTLVAAPYTGIVTTLIPVASGLSAREAPDHLGQVVLTTTRYANALLCLLTLPLLTGLYPFLRVWVGAEYARHAESLAVILIVAQFVRLTMQPYAAVGFGAGQQQRMLVSPVAEGVVNLGCSVAGAWRWGAIGVAVGTLIGAVVGDLFHFINSMPRTDSMRFSRSRLLISGIVRPAACCLPSLAAVLFAVHRTGQIASQIGLVAMGEVTAAGILWMLNFDGRERRRIVALLASAMGRRFHTDPTHAN